MSRDDWEQAIARAVVERSFRARLLADPVDALTDYGLASGQSHLVRTVRAHSLAEFAAKVLRGAANAWGAEFDGFALDGEAPC
jgi:hypothetical protein